MPEVTKDRRVVHMSLLCKLQRWFPHRPCVSQTCDGHETGKECGLPCECWCHK